MIFFKTTNFFDELDYRAVVIPVNCVGVMGAGFAFKSRQFWPQNFKIYRKACAEKRIHLGKVFVVEDVGIKIRPNSSYCLDNPRFFINFPTKFHWKEKSNLSSIELGLLDMKEKLSFLETGHVAMPAIGCGLGGLDWNTQVKPLVEKTFEHFEKDVYVHVH